MGKLKLREVERLPQGHTAGVVLDGIQTQVASKAMLFSPRGPTVSLPPRAPEPSHSPSLLSPIATTMTHSAFVSYGCCNNRPQTWWLQTTQMYYSRGQKPDMDLTGLKSSPSGGSRGEPASWPFPASRVCLPAFHGSWFPPPPAKPAMVGQVFLTLNPFDADSPASLFTV